MNEILNSFKIENGGRIETKPVQNCNHKTRLLTSG